VTGWSIGLDDGPPSDQQHTAALYDKLERTVLPLYYDDLVRWRWMMKQAIGNIAYYFNRACRQLL
jgi:glycogen phosphorylase